VKVANARARHVYRKAGFVEEGILRDAFWSGERYESLMVMSILEDEYRSRQRQEAHDHAAL